MNIYSVNFSSNKPITLSIDSSVYLWIEKDFFFLLVDTYGASFFENFEEYFELV